MLVDDKQAREKIAADDLRWLIAYSNDSKLSNQRLEEIASLIESLSAQVAELQKEIDGWKRYKQNVDEALNTGDGSYTP